MVARGQCRALGDRHTATWLLCALGGRRKGVKSLFPTTPTIEDPLSTAPGFSSAKWESGIAPGTQESKSLRLIRS